MKKISIMIIDDEEMDRYLIKRELKATNLKIDTFEATDGYEAINFFIDYEVKKEKFADSFPPFIIFLDINMPKINGFEFLKEFSILRKKIEEYQACVVIMYTSSDNSEERMKAKSYSFVKDFITKGELTSDEIKVKIENLSKELYLNELI